MSILRIVLTVVRDGLRIGMTQRILIALTLCVLVGLLTHLHVFATERTSQYLDLTSELITRKLRKRDPALAIFVETVLRKLKKKEEIVLIDVRNRDEFERFRIPASINIPLFAIKTKTFLRHRPLVLINEGHSYSPLEQECKRLRDAGFMVSILIGGLHHWREKGAPLEGDVFAQEALNRISPRLFFAEKDYEDRIVIDVSQSKESEARCLLPQGIRISYSNKPEQFISKLKARIGKHTGDRFLSVIIFDDNGKGYEKIQRLVRKAQINNVLYLSGGLEGYKRFLQQQVCVRQKKDGTRRTVKTVEKCASCP